MTQLTKTVDDATDQAVALIEQAQDATTAVVAQISETVANYVPELGLGENLLRPSDLVESGFEVSKKFLEASRKAALSFVGAVSPVTDKVFGSQSKPKSVAKSA
jgi:hypothetical protein